MHAVAEYAGIMLKMIGYYFCIHNSGNYRTPKIIILEL